MGIVYMDIMTFILQNSEFVQAVQGLELNSELRFYSQGREYQKFSFKHINLYDKEGYFLFDVQRDELVISFSPDEIASGTVLAAWCVEHKLAKIIIM